MHFYVRTDIYQAGITEDGERYTAECYYVVAEESDGRRWGHSHTFFGCRVVTDDEGWQHFQDVREGARRRADTLLAAIEQHNQDVTAEHVARSFNWHEMPAAYGSEAYSDAEAVEWERQQA